MLLNDHLVVSIVVVFIDLPLQVNILHVLLHLLFKMPPLLLNLSLLCLFLGFPLAIFLLVDGSLLEVLGERLVHLLSLLDSPGGLH